MNRLLFRTEIKAPRQQVWDTLFTQETYRLWTSPFSEGSCFEGSWEEGEGIRFLDGSGNGLAAAIVECRTGEYVSVKHLGDLKEGVLDEASAQLRAAEPLYENYLLTDVEAGQGTDLAVEMDVTSELEPIMNELWPQALTRLKQLCERTPAG